MSNPTHKLIEIVGTSQKSFADATANGVAKAASSLHGLAWFEVVELRGRIDGAKVAEYQVVMKVGFKLD